MKADIKLGVFTIAKKELLEAKRNKIVLVLAGIIWFALGIATYSAYQQFNIATEKKENAGEMFQHEWEKQEANPHSAAHFGTYLFKPINIMSIYDKGLTSYLGNTYRVEAHTQHDVNQSEAEATDNQLRFGDLSVALIFQLLMPLFILFIVFNSITKEREANTLRLVLIQGASRKALVWGKVWGNYAIILTIILPAMVLLAIPIFFQDNVTDALLRYGLFSAVYLLYFLLFLVLGVLISASHQSSSSALITAIGVWVLLVVLIPKVFVKGIDTQHPLPSRFEINRKISDGFSKGLAKDGSSAERYDKYLSETLQKYGVDSVTKLPLNFDGLSMQYSEDYNSKVYDFYSAQMDSNIQRQLHMLEWVSFLNPFVAVQQVSMGLGGTDYQHHQSFHHQAKTYRNRFIRELNLNMAFGDNVYMSYDYKIGPDFFKKMEHFKYESPTVMQAMQWHVAGILSLFIWLLLLMPLTVLISKKIR